MTSLQFISSNKYKFEEIMNKITPFNIKVSHFDLKYPELQGDTIKEIAVASAANLATVVGGDFFIEDSGLSIETLNGFPGPYSSYVFQTIGWEGILKLMAELSNRSARFISVFVIVKNKDVYTFQGDCDGTISFEGRGFRGFGFDPIFIPNEQDAMLTFAELTIDQKNKISHRANSLNNLIAYLNQN